MDPDRLPAFPDYSPGFGCILAEARREKMPMRVSTEKAEKMDDIMQHSVRAFTGGANRIVNHPSYQAYAYATFIKNSSEQVQDEKIGIRPCAYLHNCSPAARTPLDDEIYRLWLEEAPLFDKSEVLKLRNFIKKFITSRSPSGDLLYKIDNGRIRPSKALQDCLVSLMLL